MTQEFYLKTLKHMHSSTPVKRATVLIGRLIKCAVYIYYILLVIYCYFNSQDKLLPIVLVPGISFIAVSVIRYLINAPRPYDKYSLTPLYAKKTKGKSFPSRHTFSVFIIGFASLTVNVWIGGTILLLGAILAVTRVLCGVHFIKDVVAGFVCACVAALFFLI